MPALADLVVMARPARMFLTGPRIVMASIGEDVDAERLGGPDVHGSNGVAHVLADDEEDAIAKARSLVALLPAAGSPPLGAAQAPARELDAGSLPLNPRRPYDVRDVLAGLADRGSIVEVSAAWAPNVVTALARIGGHPVAFVANQPLQMAGAITTEAAEKAADFVERASRLRVPVVTLVDTPGFMPGTREEDSGVIRAGARLVRAYAAARVPRVTIVLRKAFGGAYIAMGSRDLGAHTSLACHQARIGIMGPEQAALVVHRHAIEASDDPAAERARFAAGYAEEYLTARAALDAGVVDELVVPGQLRSRIAAAIATGPFAGATR